MNFPKIIKHQQKIKHPYFLENIFIPQQISHIMQTLVAEVLNGPSDPFRVVWNLY